jgi:hypothetical protein
MRANEHRTINCVYYSLLIGVECRTGLYTAELNNVFGRQRERVSAYLPHYAVRMPSCTLLYRR